jgi:hypothetical protein
MLDASHSMRAECIVYWAKRLLYKYKINKNGKVEADAAPVHSDSGSAGICASVSKLRRSELN